MNVDPRNVAEQLVKSSALGSLREKEQTRTARPAKTRRVPRTKKKGPGGRSSSSKKQGG